MSRVGDAFQLGTRIAPPRFVLFLVLLPIALFAYRAALQATDWLDPLAIDWHGGLRYPWLEKVGKVDGGLDRLLAPKVRK